MCTVKNRCFRKINVGDFRYNVRRREVGYRFETGYLLGTCISFPWDKTTEA
jgi:hypothetical protein